MKTKQILTVIFLFVTVLVKAQTTKQATARIFENYAKELSRIVLVYETGESEVIPLKNWKFYGSQSSTNETLIENQKTINKLLNDMTEKGYEISKMTSTGDSYLYTFIIFVKKE